MDSINRQIIKHRCIERLKMMGYEIRDHFDATSIRIYLITRNGRKYTTVVSDDEFEHDPYAVEHVAYRLNSLMIKEL